MSSGIFFVIVTNFSQNVSRRTTEKCKALNLNYLQKFSITVYIARKIVIAETIS